MEKTVFSRKDCLIGGIVLAIYTAGLIFVSCFHELWFDESQAWLIAKCASYKEMLTVVPHYEGHPPLWHLFLSVFAKNGAPAELTLKAVNITLSTIAMALLIFRSPFPRIVRFVLPFTYFFFYQYGIMSRPYSLTMIAVFLAAITYKERDSKPWRYILSLMLLCSTTAYGILLSGGLCVVWTVEIIAGLIKAKKAAFFWKDKRFYPLCLILALALVYMIMINPADDCYYGLVDEYSLKAALTSIKSYECLIILPFETWSGVLIGLERIKDIPAVMAAEIVLGLGIWGALIAVTAKNKKFFTAVLPYSMLCCFMSFRYLGAHHIGIGAMFHVFIFWIMAEQEGGIVIPDLFKKINAKINSVLIRRIVKAGVFIICLAPVIYSITASVNDMTHNIGSSCLADTIKENHLEDRKIMVAWEYIEEEETNLEEMGDLLYKLLQILKLPAEHVPITENRTYLCPDATMIQPYFDKNIFMNYNVDCPDDLYMHYKYKEDSKAVFEKVREKGLPDFIIGFCPLDEIYDEETLEGVTYLPVMSVEENLCFKTGIKTGNVRMYMREDLFDDYPDLKWIDDQTDNHY